MRITYIANSRIPTERANGVQIMNMCQAFAVAGHEVTLLVPRRINPVKGDAFDYYGISRSFKLRYLPTLDLVEWGRIGFLIQAATFAVSALFHTLRERPEAVYARDEVSLWLLSFFRRQLFWEVHTNRSNVIIARVLKKCDGIVAITAGIKRFFVEKGYPEKNFMVAHDGVNLESFKKISGDKRALRSELGLPDSRLIASYIGKYKTMDQGKGVDELIHVFPEILSAVPNAFLLIVGINADEQAEVKAVIERAGIPAESHAIVGHVPHAKALAYQKASDALIINYPNQPHFAHYASPLKLFEYMASGNAIVASDLPSTREVLSDESACFVRPDDERDLARGIIETFKHPELAKSLGAAAFAKVQQYTWQHRAEAIVAFMSSRAS